MEKDISLYKEIQEPVVIFHKPVTEPHRNIPHLHSQFEFCYNIQGADGMFVDKKLYKCEGPAATANISALIAKVLAGEALSELNFD